VTDWGPEGYCKHCNRLVPTYDPATTAGKLKLHTTGYGPAEKTCEGSERMPTKRVPKESRNHRFSYTPKKKNRFGALRDYGNERGMSF